MIVTLTMNETMTMPQIFFANFHDLDSDQNPTNDLGLNHELDIDHSPDFAEDVL